MNIKKLSANEVAADSPAPTTRQHVISVLRDLAEAHPELDTREIAELAAKRLPDEERNLITDFLRVEFSSILAWELRASYSQTRHGIFAAIDIDNPDAPPIAELSEQRRETLYERITAWREYVPSQNRTRPLIDMNRVEVLESAQYDAAKTFHHGWKMLLKRRLAEALPDDVALVRDHFDPDEILSLGEQIKKEMSRGNFKLKITPAQALPRGSRKD